MSDSFGHVNYLVRIGAMTGDGCGHCKEVNDKFCITVGHMTRTVEE